MLMSKFNLVYLSFYTNKMLSGTHCSIDHYNDSCNGLFCDCKEPQASPWTNVDLSSIIFYCIDLKAFSQEVPTKLINNKSKITLHVTKQHPLLPGDKKVNLAILPNIFALNSHHWFWFVVFVSKFINLYYSVVHLMYTSIKQSDQSNFTHNLCEPICVIPYDCTFVNCFLSCLM